MSNPQSYRSKYCSVEKRVTAAQHLAELMCERSARQKNIELPDHFWKKSVWKGAEKWNKILRKHITQCNRLLQKYPAEAIIRAFNDTRTQDFLSFGNKRFLPIIGHYQKQMKIRDSQELEETVVSSKIERPRKPLGKKSTLTKLKEMDKLHVHTQSND